MRRIVIFALFVLVALILQGCATSRTEMTGKFNRPYQLNPEAGKVSVFFHFRHMSQQHGWDTIPKLRAQGVSDFNNLFRDALVELSNVERYDTFTESPADVDLPARRDEMASFRKANDYTVTLDFFEETSFSQQFWSGLVSLCSLTVIPMPYAEDYTITAHMTDRNGRRVGSYQRKASLNRWTQALLLFVYPFYPYEGTREEIYSEALHDIFRQIESEKVLKRG